MSLKIVNSEAILRSSCTIVDCCLITVQPKIRQRPRAEILSTFYFKSFGHTFSLVILQFCKKCKNSFIPLATPLSADFDTNVATFLNFLTWNRMHKKIHYFNHRKKKNCSILFTIIGWLQIEYYFKTPNSISRYLVTYFAYFIGTRNIAIFSREYFRTENLFISEWNEIAFQI